MMTTLRDNSKVVFRWGLRNRWLLVVVGLLVVYGRFVAFGNWVADFWCYAASLRELMAHPFSPSHPLLPLDTPYFAFSPYLVALSLIGRLLGMAPVPLLSAAGFLNLGLLVTGLWLLIRREECPHPRETLFYALLLWLLLWGAHAWPWSGFLHLGVIMLVLPYPASFAFGVTFIALGILPRRPSPVRLAILCLLTSLVFLAHPIVGVLLVAGFGGACFRFGRLNFQLAWRLLGVLVAGLLLAGCWPYFPFWQIILGTSSSSSWDVPYEMYTGAWQRTWPIWICLPLLFVGPGRKWFPSLFATVALVAAVYAFGWLFHMPILSRVISFLAILLQLLIALRLAAWDDLIWQRQTKRFGRVLASGIICLVLGLGVVGSWRAVYFQAYRFCYPKEGSASKLAVLGKLLADTDIVLSVPEIEDVVATIKGRVTCGRFRQAFVGTWYERRADSDLLWTTDADLTAWREIARKWGATHILVPRKEEYLQQAGQAVRLGTVIHDSADFLLVEIQP